MNRFDNMTISARLQNYKDYTEVTERYVKRKNVPQLSLYSMHRSIKQNCHLWAGKNTLAYAIRLIAEENKRNSRSAHGVRCTCPCKQKTQHEDLASNLLIYFRSPTHIFGANCLIFPLKYAMRNDMTHVLGPRNVWPTIILWSTITFFR